MSHPRMSFDDFCKNFTDIEICHLINTSVFTIRKTWKESVRHGQWRGPGRAGGCDNHNTYLDNPQVNMPQSAIMKEYSYNT